MRRGLLRNTLIGALAAAGPASLVVAAERTPAAPIAPLAAPASEEQRRFFETNVRPVLVTRCRSCHGPERQSGGLRVDSLPALLKGGASGPAVAPSQPDVSLLARALSYRHDRLKMPPAGKLPAREIADVSRWIAIGAPWPSERMKAEGGRMKRTSSKHWAFQAVRPPAVPKVRNADWVRTPIDAFVLAELVKRGLRPAPPADPRTLIRRATYDLTGLPPTAEEVEAFVRESSSSSSSSSNSGADRGRGRGRGRRETPNAAYERLIDRLLASPAYGERWGRHWLDVARYADSNGLDENVAFGNAWRYRDWVIRCFNEDVPYDRFIVEQLAGDLLPSEDTPTRHGRLTATGFLSLGPKVLAEPDKQKMVMDIVDEQVDTTGRAFMGLTLGCARCHDHKFDPISTEDYYALAGIFKSTRTMESLVTIAKWWENPIPTPEATAAKAAHDARAAEITGRIDALVERAKQELAAGMPGSALPKDVETAFKPEVRAELKQLRERLAAIRKEAPEMPAAMGVIEAEAADVPVHLRGDPQTLGSVVPRRFPAILEGGAQPPIPPKQSGRLELARWIASPSHPLTSRVLVNRVWRWHFGRGLVGSTDNFGLLGERPTHPALLDYLAARFSQAAQSPDHSITQSQDGLGWSLKRLHKLIMLSNAYQMSAGHDAAASRTDPENRFLWRASGRRLEAEEVRDALLAVSGSLDRTMGGSLLHVKNREFFFDHTSKDGTRYDSKRRAVYLPVVRNHVYDVLQLFDFADPAVLESNRSTTTVAPQALFWMNSDLVTDAAQALAEQVLAQMELDDRGRIGGLFLTLYGRPASAAEIAGGQAALARLQTMTTEADPGKRRARAWGWYCHTLLTASEFIYVR